MKNQDVQGTGPSRHGGLEGHNPRKRPQGIAPGGRRGPIDPDAATPQEASPDEQDSRTAGLNEQDPRTAGLEEEEANYDI